jgi:hypothetical protein
MVLGNSILGNYKFGGIPYIAQYQNALQYLTRRCVPEVIGSISASRYYKHKAKYETCYAWFPLFLRNVYSNQSAGNRYVNILTMTKSNDDSNLRIQAVQVKCNGSVIATTTTSEINSYSEFNGQYVQFTKTVIDTTLLPTSSIDNPVKITFTVKNWDGFIYSNTLVFVEYQQQIDIKKSAEIYKFEQCKTNDFLMTSLINSGLFVVRDNNDGDEEREYSPIAVALPEKLIEGAAAVPAIA